MIFVFIAILAAGFFLLTKGADWFVSGASAMAAKLHIPTLIIGLTVVAFGTSAPELAVSSSAALEGENAIALGNCIGSNIFNLLIVGGFSAIITPILIDRSVMKKDYLFAIVCAVLILLLSVDGNLSRADGAVSLLFFSIYMVNLVSGAAKGATSTTETEYGAISIFKMILLLIVGLTCIIAGGEMVVRSASSIARFFGVSEHIIALTIVALGTSLPELMTSLVAARKGSSEIAIGNIVGSNIFNLIMILGLSPILMPIAVTSVSLYDLVVLIAVSGIFFVPLYVQKKLSRLTGVAMVSVYAGYLVYIFFR